MFWQNFTYYCNQIGKTPNAVAAEIGIKSSGTVTGWKNGAAPRPQVLAKLAEYFHVPVNALTDGQSILTPDETQLLTGYRNFSREGKGRLLDFVESMQRSGLYEPGVDYFTRGMNAEY